MEDNQGNPSGKEDGEEKFLEKPEGMTEDQFLKTQKIAFYISGITAGLLLLLDLIFINNRPLENSIIAWFGLYLWILPILYFRLRLYQFSLHIRSEEKEGKYYTIAAIYTAVIWVACVISIFQLRFGSPIYLMPFIEWTALLFLIPSLIAIYAIKK